jgi:hypothetical protein
MAFPRRHSRRSLSSEDRHYKPHRVKCSFEAPQIAASSFKRAEQSVNGDSFQDAARHAALA